MHCTLCLTHDCNQDCVYCYAGRKFKTAMSRATAEQAVTLAARESNDELTLGFFGGEPLLEWDTLRHATEFAEALAEQQGLELKHTITTNMIQLTSDRLAYLKAHDFYVGLSIDGNRSMHDSTRSYRNGASSHDDAVQALTACRDSGIRYEVVMTIDPRNVEHLADSVEWLSSMDILNISLNPNFYIEWSDDKLLALRQGYEAAADIYISNFRKPRYIRMNFVDGKIKTRLTDGYPDCKKCDFGEISIAVAPSGNIYPCERLVGDDTNTDMCIGNVADGFDEQRRMSLIAERGNRNDDCAECKVRERCMNWCGCINYATTGAINSVSGIVCFHERMTIEVADRVANTLFEEQNPYFLKKFYPDNAESTG